MSVDTTPDPAKRYENRDAVLMMSSIRPMAEKQGRPEQTEVTLRGGTKVKVGADQAKRYGATPAEPITEPEDDGSEVTQTPDLFDPSNATVDQVNEYLTRPTTDDAERERVLALEREGNARKGVLGE